MPALEHEIGDRLDDSLLPADVLHHSPFAGGGPVTIVVGFRRCHASRDDTFVSFRFVSRRRRQRRQWANDGKSVRNCVSIPPPPPQCSVNPQLRLIELIELIDSRRTNAFTSPIHTRREDILRGEIFLLPKPHRISHPPYDFVRTTTETFIQPISVSRRVKDLDASSSLCSFCGSSRIRANFLEISMGPF